LGVSIDELREWRAGIPFSRIPVVPVSVPRPAARLEPPRGQPNVLKGSMKKMVVAIIQQKPSSRSEIRLIPTSSTGEFPERYFPERYEEKAVLRSIEKWDSVVTGRSAA